MDIKESFEPFSGDTNNFEIEREFRDACMWYESRPSFSKQSLDQDYQNYISSYQKITSLYLIQTDNNKSNLVVYDTESEREETKILNFPESLNLGTCVTNIPNDELFCFGGFPCSGIALIIDSNYNFRLLPSGTPCSSSSSIYFNSNVYCFGGLNYNRSEFALSIKFDLNENRWIKLASMPKADASCHTVIFNGNILISGCTNSYILLYSIDTDSFSKISYEFAWMVRKILINVGKLYLIECGWTGLIYESEDEYNWNPISKAIIKYDYPDQVYCSYNKGGIYILTTLQERYYKFDLSQRIMIKF